MQPTVVLIAGSPHGGTTITNLLLGQHPEVFPAGEMTNFPDGRQFTPERMCSCGSLSLECPFWHRVRTAYAGTEGQPPARRQAALYEIIARESGRRVVVDVTHKAERAFALAANAELDLRVIHLTRDGWAVVSSRIKWDYRYKVLTGFGWEHLTRIGSTARRWRERERHYERLERQLGPRAIRVGYEALCGQSATELGRVGALIGVDFAGVSARLLAGEPLEPAPHLLRGNSHVIGRDPVTLRRDTGGPQRSLLESCAFHLFSRVRPLRLLQ
ncbi:MAG: sulfotransferase [Dongiaceae bacterium]